jgi:hypothetical protein
MNCRTHVNEKCLGGCSGICQRIGLKRKVVEYYTGPMAFAMPNPHYPLWKSRMDRGEPISFVIPEFCHTIINVDNYPIEKEALA